MKLKNTVGKIDFIDFKQNLQNIDIEISDEITLTSIIGNDVEMDSQEIVELLCELEEQYNLSLPDGFILRSDSISDVLTKINSLLNHDSDKTKTSPSPYSFSRKDSIVIDTSLNEMVESIWDLSKWEEKLDHIKKIEILYDDGYNQEFLMTVQTDKAPVKVRSIRKIDSNNNIEFFQPVPPEYLLHHAGNWSFSTQNEQVYVTLEHKWNVNEEKLSVLYPDLTFDEAVEQIDNELLEHAMASLNMWKGILEGNHK